MSENNWSEKEQYDTLAQFFAECVRFWERELGIDSDLDNRAYINALDEIPHNDPEVPNGRKIDKEVRNRFIKSRIMDTYSRNEWEEQYERRKEK